MSSKVKSRKPAKAESDLETSDDDYIDPAMDVYFQKKPKKGEKASNGHAEKKSIINDESESESEEEEQPESESESEEEDLDDVELDDADEEKEGGDVEMKDQDDDEVDDGRTKITLKMIKLWSKRLSSDNPYQAINETVKAFKSALLNVVPNRKAAITKYRVDGPEMFNAMMRICMRDLLPCWLRLLNLSKQKPADPNVRIKLASTGSNWKKIRSAAKSYMEDLIILITNIHQAEILNALLRHVRLLINFYLCFPKLVKSLIKLLIAIWSQKDDKSRVISFVCLHTIAANTHEKNQSLIFKSVYLAFARNSKFTSVNTLPQIGFMQRSIIEIFSLNNKLAYEHVFVYIRQLAIHLRNAMSLKKKESYQAVYNWQYMHSLVLWSKFLSTLVKTNTGINQHLQPLIYPVVQCLIGTIKLVPTPRYYPLRLHCVNALITLSNATDVFIPVIPFILEIFDITDFNKKHATISVKSLNFSYLLKLNKQQMQDKAFKDTLIDLIYDSLILLLQHQSHDIAFPELVLPLVVRLKDFVKKCKNGNYCKVVKGLLDKIQENCKYIEERRSKVAFSLKDKKQVDLWAEKNKEIGTPLSNWYNRYKVAREREIMMEHTDKEMISRNSVLEIRDKPEKVRPELEASKEEDKRELTDLFVNWSDEEDEDLADSLDFVPKKGQSTVEAMEEEESEDDFADVINSKKNGNDNESAEEDDD